MDKEFAGKIALVTGAATGIGQATALALAREGATVIGAVLEKEHGQETLEKIRASGGEAAMHACDVSQEGDVRELTETIRRIYGKLDLAFNNAGVEGHTAPVPECSEEEWDFVLDTNLKGTWLCMKHEIPLLQAAGGGAIVNMSSIAGLVGFPQSAPYVASKHGVIGLTKSAALENAKGNIRVNVVCPGVIHTPMIDRYTEGDPKRIEGLTAAEPMGRMGRPEEVADAVIWLCSARASFVTGHALAIDGGWVAQ